MRHVLGDPGLSALVGLVFSCVAVVMFLVCLRVPFDGWPGPHCPGSRRENSFQSRMLRTCQKDGGMSRHPAIGLAVFSVLFRKKERCHGAVPLCDDPHLRAVDGVTGEDAVAMLQC